MKMHRPFGGARGKLPRRGVTLVSIMLGLLLSSFVILGMASMFKAASTNSAELRLGSSADDGLLSSVLRLQLSAQDAGFGTMVAPAYGQDIVVLTNADLGASALSGTAAALGVQGNAVVWSGNKGGGVQCAGVLFLPATDGTGGLKYLPPVSCTAASAWASLSWASQTWIESPAARNLGAINFTVSGGSCVPYGQVGLASNLRLTVAGTISAGAAISDTQCLINFR